MNKEELLKELDKIDWTTIDGTYRKFRKIALKIGANDLLKNFVNYDKLDFMANKKYMIGGLPAIKVFLYEVINFNHDIFYIDYFGNARNVTASNLRVLYNGLKDRIKKL